MRKSFFFLCLFTAAAAFAATGEGRLIKVTGFGKVEVKADIADVVLGLEVEGKTALAVQSLLAEKFPPILNSLTSKDKLKMDAGVIEIFPEYTNDNPPVIKSYRGKQDVFFSAPVASAGGLIAQAFKAGANQLVSVTVHPQEEVVEKAKLAALRLASLNAMEQVAVVLETLGLEKKDIAEVAVVSHDYPTPVYRAAQSMMSLAKSNLETKVVEGDQTVRSQVNLNVSFK